MRVTMDIEARWTPLWTPGADIQRQSRVHRTPAPVRIYDYITTEVRILNHIPLPDPTYRALEQVLATQNRILENMPWKGTKTENYRMMYGGKEKKINEEGQYEITFD